MSDGTWVAVAAAADISVGAMKAVEVGGGRLALYNVEGEFFATSNLCTHAFTFLTDGYLEGHIIECPLHAGQFDVRTGEGQGPPISCDLQTFPARVRDGKIEISMA